MTKAKFGIGTLFMVFLIISLFATPTALCQGNAQSAIDSAKNTLKGCYQSVLQAESAGANVTSLMVTLNEAADLVSQAELANAAGDYGAANNYASQSQSKLNGLTGEANALQQSAQASASQVSLFTILSLIVSVALLVSGITAWIVLSRRERRSNFGTPAI